MPVRRIWGSGSRSGGGWMLVVAIAAAALLVALAMLQYRWTEDLSRAASERMRRNLQESSRQLATDIGAPFAELGAGLLRAAALAGPPRRRAVAAEPGYPAAEEALLANLALADLLLRVVRHWRENAAFPALLQDVWIVRIDRGNGTRTAFRLDEDASEWLPDPAPADIDDLVATRRPGVRRRAERTDRLVLPLPDRRRDGRPGAATGLIVARIDHSVLEREFLPMLVERHFGGGQLGDDSPWLVSVADVSAEQERQVWPENSAGSVNAAGPPDIEFRALRLAPPLRPRPEEARRRDDRRLRGGEAERRGDNRLASSERDRPGGAWRIQVTHRSGSLEAATRAAHRRNLYISGGVLSLLAAGFGLVIVSARRSQALAAQQVDFVAGVSHELNTPVQAIRSAAENLRSGVVRKPEDVRSYGELVGREGRRLARLVEQVLQYAGIGRAARLPIERIEPGSLLDAVIAESRWFLEEPEVELDVTGMEDLPAVLGNADALRRAFVNLLHNAAKYGVDDDGRVRIAITGAFDDNRQRVTVSVTDRGPGIPARERQRIFGPFVRGEAAAASAAPGAGLGLSLARNAVREHGGDIEVGSEPGGATFHVSLPAASAKTA